MNEQLRQQIRDSRVRHYEIARKIGISEFTLSRWLRDELSSDREELIRRAIRAVLSGGEIHA